MSATPHSGDNLPDEVQQRLLKRAGADQDKHLNLARIADALERILDLQEHQHAAHHSTVSTIKPPKHPLLTWFWAEYIYPLWEFVKPQARTPTDGDKKQ